MTIYVDDMQCSYHNMIMCHMGADTTKELNNMADKIGVKRKWIQHKGTWREHFDICLTKKKLAIKYGAIEVTQREFVIRMKKRWDTKDQKISTENQKLEE